MRRLLRTAALSDRETALAAWYEWRASDPGALHDPTAQWWFPLVWWNLTSAPLEAAERATLREQYHKAWLRNQHHLALASTTLDALHRAGIETLLLKGAALALTVYDGVGVRPFGDVDVLVRPSDAGAAREVLRARGWSPVRNVEPSSLPLRHSLAYSNGSGVDFDLHWYSLRDCSGDEESDSGFWRRALPLSLEGVQTRVLCPSDQLLHLCAHGLQWTPVPTDHWLADAVTVLRRVDGGVPWAAFTVEARARRLSLQMIEALGLVERDRQVSIPSDAIAALRSGRPAWWEYLEHRAKRRSPALGPLLVQSWCAARRRRQAGPRRFVAGLQAMTGASSPWQLLSSGALKRRRWGTDRTTETCDAYGQRIRFEAQGGARALIEPILCRLPPFRRGDPASTPDRIYEITRLPHDGAPPVHYRIAVDHRPIISAWSVDDAAEQAASDLQNFLVLTAPGVTFLHAGVVCVKGRAIVLPGCSGAGKSTLVAALLRQGATYASDEFALVRADGRVEPYARRLVLRNGTDRQERRIDPADSGARVAQVAAPAACVLFTSYSEGATFSPQPLPRSQALLQLLRHCPGAHARPDETLAALRALAASATAWATPRGDADDVAKTMMAADFAGLQP
ncbi:MAG: nucleotidyltransferase family protein [Vicinamibacterales bacterium]